MTREWDQPSLPDLMAAFEAHTDRRPLATVFTAILLGVVMGAAALALGGAAATGMQLGAVGLACGFVTARYRRLTTSPNGSVPSVSWLRRNTSPRTRTTG